jgi:hypothetical protein
MREKLELEDHHRELQLHLKEKKQGGEDPGIRRGRG